MSPDTFDDNADTGWDDLRDILRIVTPFAVLVWTATLCWALSSDLRWTIAGATTSAVITYATLFCKPERVRATWAAVFVLAGVVIAVTLVGFLLYVGVQVTVAAVGWLLMFPINHPIIFVCGIVLLVFVSAAMTEERETVHPPYADCVPPTKQPNEKKKRKRRRWTIEMRRRIWEEHKRRCFYCGETLESWRGCDMHIDHVKPFSRNGKDHETNLVASCPECNLEKHAKVYPELSK